MRVPSDMPFPRRERVGSRGRVGLVVVAIALFILLTSLRGIAGFYTDLLWFDSLGFRDVFTGVLGAKVSLTALFSLVFFVLLWASLFIADRIAPLLRPAGPEEEVIERYHELIGHRTVLVRTAISALFALIAGAGVGGHWNDWILFRNARDFGVKDELFKVDIGFYVFELPFLSFVVDWAFASLVIILIVSAVAHYLNGGIRVQGAAQRVTPQVKAHLSVLLAVLALIKAVGYYLQRFELTISDRGTVDGATYTDVKAQLPALNLLILISLAAVVLFIVNIWRRGWTLPVLAVGLWAFVAIVIGGIYPMVIQRVSVQPAESSKEAPYIERNIEATRKALGLQVESADFAAQGELTAEDLTANAATVRNIRLWDPAQMKAAFARLQEQESYYRINDVDVDRYEVDGQLTQVELGVRDLHRDGIQQKSWEAQHLTYTHGQGVVMAPANAKDRNGRPDLLIKDIPVESAGGISIEQPDVYIGEGLKGYVITGTDRTEIDFQTGDETATSSYDGEDGVAVGSYLRRVAFALRFGDVNPLISGNIRSSSKIHYQRNVSERVQELAPFLSFDHDPYPVVVDGRIKYLVDGYTTTGRYPYAQDADIGGVHPDSGLNHGFNYVRNSVKAVVDAYDGTVTFYVVDEDDPIIAAYRSAFPSLFEDGDDVPEELREHFRYPEDLFVVQTNMWGRYHLTNTDDFYTRSGAWNVAQDPELSVEATTVTTGPGGVQAVSTRVKRIEPYYLLTQLPGETEPSFILFRPFVPVSEDEQRAELTAFMVASSDPDEYGKLTSYATPTNRTVDGPVLAAANIRQDEEVSRLQTELGQVESDVSFGNLIIVPIEESLLYVRPFYITAARVDIPEIRKVVVSFDGEVAVENTLREALEKLFGAAPETLEDPLAGAEPGGGGDDDEDEPGGEGSEEDPAGDDVGTLLNQATQAFEQAEAALREGDLAEYQRQVQAGRRFVERARERTGSTSSSTTTTAQPGDA